MSLRRPPFDQSPIRTDADLTACWTEYLEHEPFRSRVVWLLFLNGFGVPAGPVITIDELPDGPYDMECDELVELCRSILEGPGGSGSVALLMSRPCGDPWTVSDRAWGRFLVRAAGQVGDRTWSVHQAHRSTLVEFRLPQPAAAAGR